ncbi:hypothetical protein LCGC14_2616940, partial [marine sediment metagenome]
KTLGVRLIEQPLPSDGDAILGDITHPVLICADESCHDRTNLGELAARYNYINIKLDKAGGLTEARLLSGFWIDLSTGQFVADAVTDMGEVKRIMGLATVSVPVPVPVRRMMPEEIIDERDLTIVNLPHARVGAFAVTDSAKLVGMEVRSLLAQGRPVMNRAVRQPLVIDRGDRVNIRYSDGLLELSAPGRALGEAHRGQEVKIVNLVSNTSVVGIATAEGTVEVIR